MSTHNDSLINRAAVKREFLKASEKRYHKFTQVSDNTLDEAEMSLRLWIHRKVMEAPSKGKRI